MTAKAQPAPVICEMISFRGSEAIRKWAIECMKSRQILYRGGRNQIVYSVGHGAAYLQSATELGDVA